MSYLYSTHEIWALANTTKEEVIYVSDEGYKIRFNGEYFSEYYGVKSYGVAVTKVSDKWMVAK